MEDKPKKDLNNQEKEIKIFIDKKEERNQKNDYENLIDLGGAPPLELDNLYYNCTKCPSPIIITSIDEMNNDIEFKCHEHDLKMSIREYIEKMKQFRNKNINSEICNKHNNKYFSYCFDCNKHLCEECVKNEDHIYHYKLYLLEIKPNIKILNDIEDKINKNKAKIKALNDKKIKKENKIKELLMNNINKIKEIKDKKKEMNENKKNKEIELYKTNYKIKINKLKEEYENKITNIKIEYERKINDTKIKYKNINKINEYIYNNKINESKMKHNNIINKYKYEDEIKKLSNFNKLNQII